MRSTRPPGRFSRHRSAEHERSFGVGVIADVLAGEASEKTQRWGFEELTVFGLLKEFASKRVVQMLYA